MRDLPCYEGRDGMRGDNKVTCGCVTCPGMKDEAPATVATDEIGASLTKRKLA